MATAEAIQELFSPDGAVESVNLITDREMALTAVVLESASC
jgi:hypothetical protein